MEINILNVREIRKVDWKTAQLHFSNFVNMRPDLIRYLEETLIELCVDKETVSLDYSIDSLDWLNDILPKLIQSRDLTTEEIQGTLDDMPKEHWSIIKKFSIFTPESEYLLNLIGFFIGEMLILQNFTYYWALDNVKRSVTYKQPVLWGSGVMSYAPIQTMNVIGTNIIVNDVEDPGLVVLYKNLILMLEGIYAWDKTQRNIITLTSNDI